MSSGNYEIKAVTGDTHLGGDDFDQRLTEYCLQVIYVRHRVDISRDAIALRKLINEVDKAKRILSVDVVADINIPNLIGDINF